MKLIQGVVTAAFLSCADDSVADHCQATGPATCSAGCEPVVSGSDDVNEPCDIEGQFMGCVPDASSSFWESNRLSPGLEVRCDYLKDGDGHFLCFDGRRALYWYTKNIELFCNDRCDFPITECDEPE